MHSYIAEFPAILDSFFNTTSTYIGVVGGHKVVSYRDAQQFQVEMALE